MQDGIHDKGNLVQQFRDSKRRFVQQVMVKCGKAESSNDVVYQQMKSRHFELYKHVKHTVVHMKNYMNSMVAMGYGCAMLGEDSVLLKGACGTTEKVETPFSKSKVF